MLPGGRRLMKSRKLVIVSFFILLLLTGIFVFKDYGLYWDEEVHRNRGLGFLAYVLHGNHSLMNDEVQRSYGALPDIILAGVEIGFGLQNHPRTLYLVRHFLVFLIFYLGVVFFFFLGQKLFGSWRIGLLGCLFLVLSPRFFAQAFYNAKDIPLLAAMIAAFFTLVRFFEKPNPLNLVLHALACAVATNVRVAGILIVLLTGAAFVFLFWEKRRVGKDLLQVFKQAAIFGVLYFVFLVPMWPTLWENPIGRFAQALQLSEKIPYLGRVFYGGKIVEVIRLPWHYVPVWIAVSIPLLYLFLFIIGVASLFSDFLGKHRPDRLKRFFGFLFSLWFFVPVLMFMVGRARIYDEWRHLYFVYPALLLLSLKGLQAAAQTIHTMAGVRSRVLANTVITALVLIGLAPVTFFMVRYHPYQYVYFNRLAGRDMASAARKFELDYWGLSYKQGLEYLLRLDRSTQIKVLVDNLPGELNALILPREERQRLKFIDPQTLITIPENDPLIRFLWRYPGRYNYNFFHNTLTCRGRMTEAEKAELLSIYQDTRDRKAVEWLFLATQNNDTPKYFLTNYRLRPREFPMEKIGSIDVDNAPVLGLYLFR